MLERQVRENPVQVHVLLGEGVNQIMEVVTRDREHRRSIHLGIVEPVEQMESAGAGCAETDPQLAGVLGVSACHKGGGFFMAHLDEPNLLLTLAQGFHDPVDAIAGQTKDDLYTPIVKGIDQNLCGCLCHQIFLLCLFPYHSNLAQPRFHQVTEARRRTDLDRLRRGLPENMQPTFVLQHLVIARAIAVTNTTD